MSLPSTRPEKARIIARSPEPGQAAWQRAVAASIRDTGELFATLGLSAAGVAGAVAAADRFPCRLPRRLVDGIRAPSAEDPVLRQFLPSGAELESQDGFTTDPVGDLAATRAAGLLQKYPGRALLITTGACAVHCRYCFRRHFPYADQLTSRGAWRDALAALAQATDVSEIILSGGDPLMLADDRLAELWRQLAVMPHLARLRVHTRMPAVVPDRVTAELLELLANPRFATSVVVHVNHPEELATDSVAALGRLRHSGITVLNQSVLLRGVNDDAQTLCSLSERLFAAGVLPYYLHLLDPVAGAAHFTVSQPEAVALVRSLRSRLPGYLVPRLVRDSAGAGAKEALAC
jgi:EF-P beta-lysylation protein EpmB